MAWIQTLPLDGADAALRDAVAELRALYPSEYLPAPGDDDSRGVTAVHSLIPEALRHAMATFGVLMSPELPLDRRQHELISTRVSALNRCRY
jgi:alkylhydroperoxidase family enzyme